MRAYIEDSKWMGGDSGAREGEIPNRSKEEYRTWAGQALRKINSKNRPWLIWRCWFLG